MLYVTIFCVEREVKIQQNQQQDNQLRELHQEDSQAGGSGPPFNRTESRDMHHRLRATWAGELQGQYGNNRRGPAARDW
jgi:hypothetical protein